MASRSVRRNGYQPNVDLLPVDYHGLEIQGELRSHTENFRLTKEEITQGKRRRRNSTSDSRTSATIQASGPDHRFNDIAIPESGIRDGLNAIKFMPPYPNVQDFTRRSARWDDEEQASVSENEALDISDSSLSDSISDFSDFSDFEPSARFGANALKQNTRSASKVTSTTPVPHTGNKLAKGSTNKGLPIDGIFYKCYAENCNYEHTRRFNFSIHWKRDAKHPGTFDLQKVLQCSRDQAGRITTVPYGSVNPSQQRSLFGMEDNDAMPETSLSTSSSDMETTAPYSKKSKALTTESRTTTRTASRAAAFTDQQTTQQDLNSPSQDLSAPDNQSSSARIYSSLECQIFRKLTDVPKDFPAHITPLISHGPLDTGSTNMKDCRFFCPECDKCFTQTHNVASHFSSNHGKKYSKNDRARTVFCQVTLTQKWANIDAKPVDDTILPRLQQIRRAGMQTPLSGQQASITVADKAIDKQADAELTTPTNASRERVTRMQAVKKAILAVTSTSSTSLRQPAWDETNEPAEGSGGWRGKRARKSDGNAEEEGMEGGGEEEGSSVQEPAKRRKMTLAEYMALGRGSQA